MILEEIAISNFKGLKGAVFTPKSFTCLVGENNAGKSTLFQAVVYALNQPTNLPDQYFYDVDEPVVFRCKFSGIVADDLLRLKEEHRPRIEPLIYDSKFSLIVRFFSGEKVDVKVLKKVPADDRYRAERISEIFHGTRGNAVREAFEANFPEWTSDFVDGSTQAATKELLAQKIGALPDDAWEYVETIMPSGITASIKKFLPQPIYIPAVKNVNDDLKTTQSTSFGQLIGMLLRDLEPDLEELGAALSSLNRLLNRVTEEGREVDERKQKVKDLEGLVEGYLKDNFPGASVQLEIPPPELKTILNSAQIYIDDGSRDLVDQKGDGIKRALTFALLRAYVRQQETMVGDAGNEHQLQPLIFLFEEPELYLHPKSQRILFNTLASISASHQVLVSTHSSLFFSPGVTAKFVRVSKAEEEPKPVGVLHPVDFDLDPDSGETFKLAKIEHAEAGFFASRVILFEGESDDLYLNHVARTLDPAWCFQTADIAMVRVGGKGNFERFRKFFELFGIKVLILADLDVLFNGYSKLGASPTCDTARDAALLVIDRRAGELGITAQRNSQQVKKKVTNGNWKERYDATRAAINTVKEGGEVTPEVEEALESLFVWEEADVRENTVTSDQEAGAALVPLLDELRNEGIYVLGRGAIEDYYPDGVPSTGRKPDRAIQAVGLLETRDAVIGCSQPLAAARPSELEEIFGSIFN